MKKSEGFEMLEGNRMFADEIEKIMGKKWADLLKTQLETQFLKGLVYAERKRILNVKED